MHVGWIDPSIFHIPYFFRLKIKVYWPLCLFVTGKKSVVTEDAFFSLLEMNGIMLTPNEKI